MDPSQQNTFGSILGSVGNFLGGNGGSILGGMGGLYGAYQGAQTGQNFLDAANAGYGMGRQAFNPTLFGMNGVGGSGFSVSSPAGGPASISSSLGAFNPMYGNYANAAGQYTNASLNLANTASSGATGAYQSALASMMPQLQQMQSNLLASNNNGLFQRGQLGSGSYGQMGAGGNPVNLTTQSLGAGFAQQDLNAIMAAQNQGLNFFNSNLQGAGALGNLGFGATNTGMGMLGAQNQLGQMPLQYSNLFANQEIGATSALAGMLRGANPGGINAAPGWGSLASGIGGGFGGGGAAGTGGGANGGPMGAIGGIIKGLGGMFGGGGGNNPPGYDPSANGGLDYQQNTDLENWINQGAFSGYGGDTSGGLPPP